MTGSKDSRLFVVELPREEDFKETHILQITVIQSSCRYDPSLTETAMTP